MASRTLAATILLGLLSAAPAAATHIVGGQLRMTNLGPGRPDMYTLGLTLYFDDVNGNPGALDQDAILAIYEKGTNTPMDTFQVFLTTQQPVAYTDPTCQINSLRTKQITYYEDVTLDPLRYQSSRGYYMVWERCCRNDDITNIIHPESTGQTFYLEFPALRKNGQSFINSSPAAFEPVRDPACVNVPFQTPFGGVDPDGDSLVYAMVMPLRGNSDTAQALVRPIPPRPAPYRRVRWMPGFDSLRQIDGVQPLTVDSRTGVISFTANQPGLYVFAVRCTEYRNGVRLGEVRREFQELVVSCPPNQAPVLDVTQIGPPGQALPYVPGTVLQLPDPPADRCLSLYALDSEANSRLTFQVIAPGAPSGTVLPTLSVMAGTVNPNGRRDTLEARLCFDACFGRDGLPLRLALVLSDRACPAPRRDTAWVTVQGRFIPDTPPTIAFPDPATAGRYVVRMGQQVAFDFTGTDVDPGSRVSVRSVALDVAPLAGLGISCPRRTGDGTATTRLTWDITCATPPGDYVLYLQTQSEACGRGLTTDTVVRVTVLPTDTTRTLPPNIITPNADGLNDAFQPAVGLLPTCMEEFRRVRIFNRWGREVFASPDRLAIWRAESISAGMYFYFLEYSDRVYKGWVEVVK